jgi:branched-chain amino acid transport system permease protein
VLIALIPIFVRDVFYLHLGSIILLAVATSVAWNIIAKSGQISFGHAGFLAIGAYASAILTTRLNAPFLAGFVLAGLLAGIIATLLGIVFTRAEGIFFGLLTMGASELIRLLIVNLPSLTYGHNGIGGLPPPVVPILNMAINSKVGWYWLNLFFAALVVVFAVILYRSPWGNALLAVRDNSLLAECTGIATQRYKVLAFSIGCTITGLTGSLFAHFLGFVGPESFTFWRSIDAMAMNVIGGMGSVAGPIIGAFVISPLPEFLRGFVHYQVAFYGLTLVLVVVFLPNGLISLVPRLRVLCRRARELEHPRADSVLAGEKADMYESLLAKGRWTSTWAHTERNAGQHAELLHVNNVTKSFGGLAAVDNVTFSISQGEILGVIGPNGAGKTTLFNLVSGVTRPDSGTILFKSKDITCLKPHEISRQGLSRTFQAVILYNEATVWQNLMRARSFQSGVSFLSSLLGTRRRNYLESCRRTELLLSSLGLNSIRETVPSALPYGLQKQVQLAVALATEPELILLDEPVSGMNQTEAAVMAQIIKQVCNSGLTVVIVEHNMNFVMSVCERIVVLDHGVKIAEGTPEEIQNNPNVVRAYLGAIDAA